ncbi:glycosyl transferase [Lactococcus piscium]|uniref:Glycosyl transferase n=1 Tax=Pseudolactococcus piscium TaxID=1364 RepID=A0A2A5RZA8_9LACT|nr:glycosyltransferase [Lactococcus piscium]PCS06586.1 glycosyl transferase [Lactococcus piscium]
MKIGIVILNYIVYKDVFGCVDSLTNQSFKDYEIVIVDNGSPNDSFYQLKEKYKDRTNINVIKTDGNIGFARGNNAGIKYLKNKNIFNIFAINADTFIEDEKYLEKLVNMPIDNNCAFIGTSIIGNDLNNQNPYNVMGEAFSNIKKIRRYYIKNTIYLYLIPLRMWDRIKSIKSLFIKKKPEKKITSKSVYLDLQKNGLHGAAIFFTETYLKTYKGFYPDTFLYTEEDYLNLICRRLNFSQLYIPELEIYHKEGSSNFAAQDKSEKKAQLIKNKRILKAISNYNAVVKKETDFIVNKIID